MRTYNYYCTWTTQNYVAKNRYVVKKTNSVYAVSAVRRSCSDLPKVSLKLENHEKFTFENLIDGKILNEIHTSKDESECAVIASVK